jgi:hypothetical protein
MDYFAQTGAVVVGLHRPFTIGQLPLVHVSAVYDQLCARYNCYSSSKAIDAMKVMNESR